MITVTPDATGRAGTAQLRFDNAAAESASARLRIRRDGWDDGILGPNGWQGEDAWLQPDEVETSGADLLVTVGWTVCQHLQADTYLVSLSRPATEAPAAWPDIRPVRAAPRARSRSPGAATVSQTLPDVQAPAPLVEEVPVAIQTVPPTSAAVLPTVTGQAVEPAIVGATHGKRGYLVGAGLVALLLMAGAGYLYWQARSTGQHTQVAAASTTTPAPTLLAQTTPSPVAPAPSIPAQPPPQRALADMNVPDVLAHAPDLTAVTAEGQRRLAGQQHDDGLLLLEEASDRGDGGAMAALGSLYDPVGFQPGGVLAHPDARQAARYYQSAERASAPGVATKREALRSWLQARAAGGDLQAGLVLKDFWS